MRKPLCIRAWPQAIVHVDGDGFFASCEQALNPALRGRPVVTGAERGIASAMSYEAKRLGITRAMPLGEIKRRFPQVVILPSDYETYGLFSQRMYAIVRRYTSEVEEYGIDECFGNITGMRRSLKMTYAEIAAAIKNDLERELGMTFSVGLGPTKVLAKVGSKWNKPSGLTIMPGYKIEEYLGKLPVGKVWGIGPQTSAFLNKQGIHTALELAEKGEGWVRSKLSKPYHLLWQELRGVPSLSLDTDPKEEYQSISKTRTFTPPSTDRDFVYSQLSKNIENACIKARRYNLSAARVFFYLKSQDFRYHGYEIKLSVPLAVPTEILALVKKYFDLVYKPGVLYRATGVVLSKLEGENCEQLDLFGESARVSTVNKIYATVDELAERFGKHAVFLASSFRAMRERQHQGARAVTAYRKEHLFKGETTRRRLNIPLIGEVA
jgi:DNA polymerase IV